MANNEERRKSDEKIEKISNDLVEVSKMVKEIHQRQNEVTLPALADIKNTLYSKGGVCETILEHTGEIKEIRNRVDRFPTIVTWVLGGVSAGAWALLWMWEAFHKFSGGAK